MANRKNPVLEAERTRRKFVIAMAALYLGKVGKTELNKCEDRASIAVYHQLSLSGLGPNTAKSYIAFCIDGQLWVRYGPNGVPFPFEWMGSKGKEELNAWRLEQPYDEYYATWLDCGGGL